jgi:hypothetical protein
MGAATRWALGLVALATLTVVTHGLAAPRLLSLGLDALLVVAAVALARKRWVLPERSELYRLAGLTALLAVPLTAAWLLTVDQPVGAWDAVHIWYSKTRCLQAWRPFSQIKPDPHYPHLGAACWALMLELGAFESLGRTVFAFIYFAFVASLLESMGRPYRWSTLAALGATFLVGFDLDACTNGYQDTTVAALVGLGAVILTRILFSADGDPNPTADERAHLAAAGLLCGAAGLVKNEGLFVGLIVTASFTAVVLLRRAPSRWRALLSPLRPLLVAQGATMLLWPLLSLLNGLDPRSVQGNAFSLKTALTAYRAIDRWPAIRPYFDAHLARVHLLVLVGGVASLAAMALSPRARKPLVFLWSAWTLHLGFVLWVFFSTQQELGWHLETAFARVASQGIPLVMIAAVVALGTLLQVAGAPVLRRFGPEHGMRTTR